MQSTHPRHSLLGYELLHMQEQEKQFEREQRMANLIGSNLIGGKLEINNIFCLCCKIHAVDTRG